MATKAEITEAVAEEERIWCWALMSTLDIDNVKKVLDRVIEYRETPPPPRP